VALLSFGARLGECLKAADELAALGLSTTVADARFAKPLDLDLVLRLARGHEVLVTIEEGSIGGFGSFVLQALAENGVLDAGCKVRSMTLPDVFQDQDTPAAMYAKAGLDAKGIVTKVFEALGKDATAETSSWPDGYNRFLRGTLAPFLRASERPIAIACFLLLTLRPLRPLLSVPFLRFFIARSTDFEARLEYFRAMMAPENCSTSTMAITILCRIGSRLGAKR